MFNTESEININVTGRIKEYNEEIIGGDLQVTESKHDTLLTGYHRVNDIWKRCALHHYETIHFRNHLLMMLRAHVPCRHCPLVLIRKSDITSRGC